MERIRCEYPPLPKPPPLLAENSEESRPPPPPGNAHRSPCYYCTLLPSPIICAPARTLAAVGVRLPCVVMSLRATGLANELRGFVCSYGGLWFMQMNYRGSFACTKGPRMWMKSLRKAYDREGMRTRMRGIQTWTRGVRTQT